METHMKKIISGFVLGLIVQVSALAQPTPEKLVIKSHTPQDFADIISGRYRQMPVDIHGFLAIPAGSGKFPAVVIGPGSGGYKPWMQDMVARRLNDAGIATLVLDSFTGRGVTETATNQGNVPTAAGVIDGFAALKALASRSEIDVNRLGITGFSRGGTVAMFTNEKKLMQAMELQGLQYAAHLPMYPACSTTFDKPDPTTAPMWILMGEKDDYTPASQCLPFIERLRTAGSNVKSKIFPDAHHGWVSDARQVTYQPRVQVFSKCDGRIDDTGVIRELSSGATTSEGWTAFVTKVWKSCGKYGANYGVNETARDEALKDMVQFFSDTLKLKP